jgi:toxin ParE1/3/4
LKVTFSPAAQEDLIDIAVYIAQDNAERALSFVDALESKCDALGAEPGTSTARPDFGKGIRMLPHGRYLIFCRPQNTALRIERIIHSARSIVSGDFAVDEPAA